MSRSKRISSKLIRGGSKRGLTFSDKSLAEIGMKPGSKYQFIIDKNKGKVLIKQADDGNTVSRKKVGKSFKPLIDIRSQEVIEQFKQATRLLVEFYDSGIIIISSLDGKGRVNKQTISRLPDHIFDGTTVTGEVCDDFLSRVQAALKTLRVISFFSGAGMLDYSFVEQGFEVVWANDAMKGAVKTYKENIGNHIVLGDIRDIDKSTIPSGDVLVAGFPCVAYSNVNRSQTRNEKHDDAFLYREILETARVKPGLKIIAIENVAEFLTANDGEFYEEFKVELEALGFVLSHRVVVDKGYGGFSDRKRVIIIASKIGEIQIPEPSHDVSCFRTVGEAFKENITVGCSNQLDFSKSRPDTVKRMQYVKPGENWQAIPEELRSKGKFHNFFRRLSLENQSPTLVNWRKSVIMTPEENRILSVREAAAIMGMPPSFSFFGTLAEKQQQVANGVTKAIGLLLASTVKDAWMRSCF